MINLTPETPPKPRINTVWRIPMNPDLKPKIDSIMKQSLDVKKKRIRPQRRETFRKLRQRRRLFTSAPIRQVPIERRLMFDNISISSISNDESSGTETEEEYIQSIEDTRNFRDNFVNQLNLTYPSQP